MSEIYHAGIRGYKITVTNKAGETVYAIFDRFRDRDFVTTPLNQMISNTLASVLKTKGADWGIADYKVLEIPMA